MTKKIFSLFISVFFLLASVSITSAHILETDHSIGAILHIDPNDAPLTNRQSVIIFEIKDKQNKFLLSDCDCTLAIIKGKSQISSQTLTATSDKNVAVTSYTFPDAGAYTLSLRGKPLQAASFQPFTLNYIIRAESGSDSSSSSIDFIFWGEILAGILLIVGIISFFTFSRKKKS